MTKQLVLFAGNSNKQLAINIARHLKKKLVNAEVKKFSDSESYARILESVRGKDVFIIQSLCNPVNHNLMELLIMIDAAKRASAERINAVIPYMAYSRQDRCTKPREPISAKLVADIIETAGAHRVITMDIHSPQSQGFFDIPLDNLFVIDTFVEYIKKKKLNNVCIVAPDIGAVKNAKKYAQMLKASIAIIVKQRPKPEQAEATHVIGDVKGKNCIIIDDIINIGGTIKLAVNELMKRKANKVYVMATHGIFAGNGFDTVMNSKAREVIVTDTIPQERKSKKFKVISVSKVFAEAINKVHLEQRLSPMFKDWSQ